MQTQSQFPVPNVSRFRRGMFQIRSTAQPPLRSGFGMSLSQGQGQLTGSQTLRSLGSSQVGSPSSESQTNGSGMGWLNTQAFFPPETQDTYESD